jgi:malate dehydrogenase (oxaloacetate-decarboxylating)(NADP+)
MLERGDADGMVTGLHAQLSGDGAAGAGDPRALAGRKVAVGMYMMVLQNSVRFFGDTVFNIDPDAETLADIAVQMADAVAGFDVDPARGDDLVLELRLGEPPRRHARCKRALELVRARRPQLEIDGEMQPELALDAERRREHYGFSRLTRAANTLVFPSLAAGNAAYQTLKVLGNAAAVGPILLGLAKPVAVLQNEATVEDLVNMTAYVVMNAQRSGSARSSRSS